MGTKVANHEQHDETRQPDRSVQLGVRQALQGVDDDLVGSLTGIDALDAEGDGRLGRHYGDAGSCDEGGNGNIWNELDDPAEAEQAKEEQD